MKDIEDVLYDPKVEWESDGWQSTLTGDSAKKLMREYALEIVNYICKHRLDIFNPELEDCIDQYTELKNKINGTI